MAAPSHQLQVDGGQAWQQPGHLPLPVQYEHWEGQPGLEGGHCTDGETEARGGEGMPRRNGGQVSKL